VNYLKSIVFLSGLFLWGCQLKNDPAHSKVIDPSDLPGIVKKGKLTVLMENSLGSFFIYKGRKMGLEYDLLKIFAKEIGVELEVKIVNHLDEIEKDLQKNEGDLIACSYILSLEKKHELSFSIPYQSTQQVLVQRNDAKVKIKDPSELAHKKVYIRANSGFYKRLLHLQEEIGDTIYIEKQGSEVSSEELIEMVSDGIIDYTVVSKSIAEMNQAFYDNLNCQTPISFKQKIAFAGRKNNPLLMAKLNEWLAEFINKPQFKAIKNKYTLSNQLTSNTKDVIINMKKGELSPYDAIFRKAAEKYDWDWLLLASQSYHESRFNPNARAFGGAYGIMQFMPGTGRKYGVHPNSSVEVQIEGGMKYIHKEYLFWKHIKDLEQRRKFTLAAYNAGRNHIVDAQKLASKYGLNPDIWDDNVEQIVRNLSKHKYYTDKLVSGGALKGHITYRYVKDIYKRYEEWKLIYH
jgi:membrane-bound lytic murein transglycosylase F